MASNCEDVSAQMMELLYGELPADARASVDAHVAGCARCRAEMEGFEKTRGIARRGLHEDDAPPARVHAAIMQAAAAHLATQRAPAASHAQPAAEKVSFWDRLRTRWAFPTLATVGAVAVFVVANRVFLNPERTLEPHHAAEAPAPEPVAPTPAADVQGAGTAAQPSASEPNAAAEDRERSAGGAAPSAHRRAPADVDAFGNGGKGEKKAKKRESVEGDFAGAPSQKPMIRADEKAKADRDEGLENKFAPPPPPRDGTAAPRIMKEGTDKAPAPREAARPPLIDMPKSVAPARKPAPARAIAESVDDLLDGESGRRAGGGSASGKGAVGGLAGPSTKSGSTGAGAAQAARAAPRPATSESRSAPVAAAAPSAAPAAPAPPPATLSKSRAKASVSADESYEAPAEAAPAKDEQKVAAKNGTNETILLRADRLFAEGRWAEAAALYRELLRRDPRNDDAERWRRRLVAAENAEVTAQRNANVAAKRATPPQDKAEAESAARAGKQQQQPAAKPAKASKAAAADVAQ